MSVILRTAIGVTLAALGLTLLTYGIAQAIENGSCGVDEYGNVLGAPCPSGFAAMIMLMIGGSFVGLIGAAIGGVLARGFVAAIFAVGAGVALGFADLNPDDTRPGPEILAVVGIPMLLFVIPGIGRRRRPRVVRAVTQPAATFQPQPAAPPPPTGAAPPPQWEPRATTPAEAEDIASRLRQLDQLKQSGLLGDVEYAERRRQILAEL